MEENEEIKEKPKKKYFTKERLKTIAIVVLSLAVLGNVSDNTSQQNSASVNNSNLISKQQIIESSSKEKELENKLEKYQDNISSLQNKNDSLTKENTELKKEVSELKDKTSKLQKQLSSSTSSKSITSNSSSSNFSNNKSSSSSNTKNSHTVYITSTGSKYHRSGCSYLRQSKIAISIEEAEDRGLTPCSRCNP